MLYLPLFFRVGHHQETRW